VGKTPQAKLMVYWNKKEQKVMVNNANKVLPAHDAQHQFQLWAIVEGQSPVDLGVFSAENEHLIFEMKKIGAAQAFAVTIEKKGGSPVPTLDQMVVMGAI
ncbi:MAG: anti-sigma factor, partial [Pedobacter sp.]